MEKGPLIGTGRTADVFAWGNEHVLKLYQAWMPRVAIEREFAITCIAHTTGLPVPATEEIVEVDGRLGIVFERLHGPSLLKVLEAQPWKLFSIARWQAELHAKMHACSLPPDTYSQRQQIERGLELATGLSEAEKQTILDSLARLPEANAVCHGDFHPDNIILTDHGPVIIDWMTGTRGHPLCDVARSVLLLRTGGLPPRISLLMGLFINASRKILVSVYLNHYTSLQGVSRSEISAWELPLLAARLFEVENYPQEKRILLLRIHRALANN